MSVVTVVVMKKESGVRASNGRRARHVHVSALGATTVTGGANVSPESNLASRPLSERPYHDDDVFVGLFRTGPLRLTESSPKRTVRVEFSAACVAACSLARPPGGPGPSPSTRVHTLLIRL
jgi:hypothetical protein